MISYPEMLPCPTVSVVTPAERRLVSDMAGPKGFRSIQRDYLADERLEWTLRQDESETFNVWWRDTLLEGGAWFGADWPSPQGGMLLRRFSAAPKWDYIHNGTDKRSWKVSVQCEVRNA